MEAFQIKAQLANQKIHPNITESMVDFYLKDRMLFFFFLLNKIKINEINVEPIDFVEEKDGVKTPIFPQGEKITTAAVFLDSDYKFNMTYNKSFIDSLTIPQTKFLLIHEMLHLIHNHLGRRGNRMGEIDNWAADVYINETIIKEFSRFCDSPSPDGQAMADSHFKDELFTEKIYEWTFQKYEELKEKLKSINFNDSVVESIVEKTKEGKNLEEISKEINKDILALYETPIIDNIDLRTYKFLLNLLLGNNGNGCGLDNHIQDKLPDDIRQQLVGDYVNEAKMRGYVKGALEGVVNHLIKNNKDNYIYNLKKYISFLKGVFKERTFLKLNKKVPDLKGNKKYGMKLNAILDTSGSMMNDLDFILSEIYKDGIEVNLIQIDTEVSSVDKISDKKKLEKIKLKGFGGTELQPAINYLVENKMNGFPTVILTDGYCDKLDLSKLGNKNLIISCGVKVELLGGKAMQIVKQNKP